MNVSLCRLAEMPEKGVYVDLGIYGWSSLPDWRGRDPTLRLFEQFALEHGGYQVGSIAASLWKYNLFLCRACMRTLSSVWKISRRCLQSFIQAPPAIVDDFVGKQGVKTRSFD